MEQGLGIKIKNLAGCKDFPEHKCEFYNDEYKDLAKIITNTICKYHNAYYNFSPHMFHRELAEELIDVFMKLLEEKK